MAKIGIRLDLIADCNGRIDVDDGDRVAAGVGNGGKIVDLVDGNATGRRGRAGAAREWNFLHDGEVHGVRTDAIGVNDVEREVARTSEDLHGAGAVRRVGVRDGNRNGYVNLVIALNRAVGAGAVGQSNAVQPDLGEIGEPAAENLHAADRGRRHTRSDLEGLRELGWNGDPSAG